MKRKFQVACRYLSMSSFLLIVAACDKYLDIDITDENLETNYFTNEARITQGIGGSYAAIADIYGPNLSDRTLHGFWLLPADDITFGGSANEFETFGALSGDNLVLRNMWANLYRIIGNCNFMLEKIGDHSFDAVYKTTGLKEANKAEMLFIRSWCNFKLWDNWRKAPLQDKRMTVDNAILPPSKGFELLDNAISSLEEAAPLAFDTWDNNNLGRITKDACYGLLVKLYVTRACYNTNNDADYEKAIVAFGNISASRKAAFGTVKYGENFDYRYENNPESLFEFQAGISDEHSGIWQQNVYGQIAAFYHYGDGHWSNYNSGVFGPTQKLMDAFDPGDPRKSETFRGSDVDTNGGSYWWINPNWGKFGNHQLVKYTNGERGNFFDLMWQIGSGNNPRLLRLADVKLCVAEAYLATGNSVAALSQVNDVRERARKSVSPESNAPVAYPDITMEKIMKERMIELAGEDGQRWSDFKRWHAAGFVNLANWTASDFGFRDNSAFFKFEIPKNLLFPIPSIELDRNPLMKASGQNPGYN